MRQNMHKYWKTLTFIAFSSILLVTMSSCSNPITDVKVSNNFEKIGENKNNISYKYELSANILETKFQNTCSVTDVSKDLLDLSNSSRSQKRTCGSQNYAVTSTLMFSCELQKMAERHAQDLAERDTLSHLSGDGKDLATRANELGLIWQSLGENIASGQKNSRQVHQAWLDSAQHCTNIMSSDYEHMGAALNNNIWVVVFAKLKGKEAVIDDVTSDGLHAIPDCQSPRLCGHVALRQNHSLLANSPQQ